MYRIYTGKENDEIHVHKKRHGTYMKIHQGIVSSIVNKSSTTIGSDLRK